MRSRIPMGLLGLLAFVATASAEAPALDLEARLAKPGVRFLAVEVLAPGNAAPPALGSAWRRVQLRYGEAGLRVLVVIRPDPEGQRGGLPWVPDGVVFDRDGRIAAELGASDRAATFLWSWRGERLVDGRDVEAVAAAADAALARAPALDIEVRGSDGEPAPALGLLVRDALAAADKLTVRSTSVRAGRADAPAPARRCGVAEALSARTVLRGTVTGKGAGQRLALALVSGDNGCASEPLVVRFNADAPLPGVRAGVTALLDRLAGTAPAAPLQAAAPSVPDPPPMAPSEAPRPAPAAPSEAPRPAPTAPSETPPAPAPEAAPQPTAPPAPETETAPPPTAPPASAPEAAPQPTALPAPAPEAAPQPTAPPAPAPERPAVAPSATPAPLPERRIPRREASDDAAHALARLAPEPTPPMTAAQLRPVPPPTVPTTSATPPRPVEPPLTVVTSGRVGGVVQVPSGAIVFLDRGKRHGVVVGMRGQLCDLAFVVQKVDEWSSEGFTPAGLEHVGACSEFRLLR